MRKESAAFDQWLRQDLRQQYNRAMQEPLSRDLRLVIEATHGEE